MIDEANSFRPIGIDLSRSSESDTVTKRRPCHARSLYACYLYAYIRHACRPIIYALERFILNIFCTNRRIYFIRLFYNVPILLF